MPYLQEALIRGLINYGALADELMPRIKEEINKPVKHSAVMMALRRFSEKNEVTNKSSFRFSPQTTITIKSGLFNVAYKKSLTINKALQRAYEIVDYSSGDVLAINLGNHEITIVSNAKNLSKIKSIMKNETIIHESKNVAAISLSLTIELMDMPGFFYLVTRALTWEDINIREVVSTPTELTIIVDEKEVMKGYGVLRDLFK
jgi:aspartokinase